MTELKVAFATDDKASLIDRHFGDANFFVIFQLSERKREYIFDVKNSSIEEDENEIHGDPRKAKSITKILKEKQVTVLVSKRFGPNIKRIKQHFVPIMVNVETIHEAISLVQQNFSKVTEELSKGEKREHLRFVK